MITANVSNRSLVSQLFSCLLNKTESQNHVLGQCLLCSIFTPFIKPKWSMKLIFQGKPMQYQADLFRFTGFGYNSWLIKSNLKKNFSEYLFENLFKAYTKGIITFPHHVNKNRLQEFPISITISVKSIHFIKYIHQYPRLKRQLKFYGCITNRGTSKKIITITVLLIFRWCNSYYKEMQWYHWCFETRTLYSAIPRKGKVHKTWQVI